MAQFKSDADVEDLEAPETGQKIFFDGDHKDAVKGFGVRVMAGGARSFILDYRIKGRQRRITIGSFGPSAWSTVAARKRAKELRREVDLGGDPMGERHEGRAAATMGDLIDRFVAEYLPKKRPSTKRDYTALLENHVRRRFGKVKVADIKHGDIDRLHREISASAPYQANRMVAVLSKLFSFAIKAEMRTDNPAKGIERNAEEKRERFLSGAELAYLTAALDGYSDQRSADAIRLLLLTGARRGEVLGATWEMFDLAEGIWVKPSSHTKQKKTHRVPLSAPTVELLKAIHAKQVAEVEKARREDRVVPQPRYVFPGDKPDAPLVDIKKAWAIVAARATVAMWADEPDTVAGRLVVRLRSEKTALLAARNRAGDPTPTLAEVRKLATAEKIDLSAGLTDVRIHDLRHSYASILASAGLSLPIIGALLGHTQPGTTARYAHLLDDPLRAATEHVGSTVKAAATAPKQRVVVSIPKG